MALISVKIVLCFLFIFPFLLVGPLKYLHSEKKWPQWWRWQQRWHNGRDKNDWMKSEENIWLWTYWIMSNSSCWISFKIFSLDSLGIKSVGRDFFFIGWVLIETQNRSRVCYTHKTSILFPFHSWGHTFSAHTFTHLIFSLLLLHAFNT